MLINQHEGHVWAENTDLGPMFSFVLPLQSFKSASADNIHMSALKRN
jgi:signal transduction histidine kinase